MILISYYAYKADENFLAHYGVVGMRWGVRKTPEERKNFTSNKEMRKAKKEDRKKAHLLTGSLHYQKSKIKDLLFLKKHVGLDRDEIDAYNARKEYYNKLLNDSKKHVSSMIKKYGNNRVKIKYDKNGNIKTNPFSYFKNRKKIWDDEYKYFEDKYFEDKH